MILFKTRNLNRCFSTLRKPGNLDQFLGKETANTPKPMTKREKFAQEQFDREKKPLEEENHEEQVSFGGNYVYLKFAFFSFICFYSAYRVHCAITKKIDDRNARFNGEVPVYDPSDPETQAKMTEKERMFAEPGGPW